MLRALIAYATAAVLVFAVQTVIVFAIVAVIDAKMPPKQPHVVRMGSAR